MDTLDILQSKTNRGAHHRGFLSSFCVGAYFLVSSMLPALAYGPGIPATPSEREDLAKRIHMRVAGIPPSAANLQAMIQIMEASGGTVEAAAQIPLNLPEFINNTVKQFAAPLISKDRNTTFINDAMAMIMCSVKYNEDYRNIMTSPNTCRIDPSRISEIRIGTGVNDIQGIPAYQSESGWDLDPARYHYPSAELVRLDFSNYLISVPRTVQEKAYDRQNVPPFTYVPFTVPPPETVAGILTSKAAMSNFMLEGTNRAVIDWVFESFLCTPLMSARDSSFGDDPEVQSWVMSDVPRKDPGFQTTCMSCHGGMDPLATAFNYHNSRGTGSDNVTQRPLHIHGVSLLGAIEGANAYRGGPLWQLGMPYSGYKNRRKLPTGGGYTPPDPMFKNFYNRGANAIHFGWRGSLQGSGARAFGSMISKSRQFSRCTVTNVFKQVCRRAPDPSESALVESMTDAFEDQQQLDYKLRKLFGLVAGQRGCISD